MRYTKPQFIGYAAIAAIQSGSSSKTGMTNELNLNLRSIPAYEADE